MNVNELYCFHLGYFIIYYIFQRKCQKVAFHSINIVN
jgi:hypothetical protein